MTLTGRLASYFPAFHILIMLYTITQFIKEPGLFTLTLLAGVVYLVPPVLFRLYTLRYPVKTGRWILNHPIRSEWWVAHQLQAVYAAVPFLEALLRLLPGVYSFWLRLWGSKIGWHVHWTPCVELLDRHLLTVGDFVIFGHQVCCTAHIMTKKSNGNLVLMTRPVSIGEGTLIGAKVRIGPGVQIPDRSVIPYNAEYRFTYSDALPNATNLS